jgi:hypothetical protein
MALCPSGMVKSARLVRRILILLALVLVLAWQGERLIERRVHARLLSEAAAHGMQLSVERTAFGWTSDLVLHGVRASKGAVSFTCDDVLVEWSYAGGRDPRRHLRGLRLAPGSVVAYGATLRMPATSWAVESWTGDGTREAVRLRDRASGGALGVAWQRAARELEVAVDQLDVGRLVRAEWNGEQPLRAGTWTGMARLTAHGELSDVQGTLQADGLAFDVFDAPTGRSAPAPLRLGFHAMRRPGRVHLDVDATYASSQIDLVANLTEDVVPARVEGRLEARVDVRSALRSAGIPLPATLAAPDADLGVAVLEAEGSMTPGDRPSLDVRPALRFEPPARELPALAALRTTLPRPVSTFVAYEALPPLFVRTLLISEDAGFWGHPGIDVAEIPVAWATNEERGRAAFGASTLTQQLVKNLFLSGEKTYARKAQEAALALLLDATVPKARLLEIYVNVIEWGPGLHGIGPAAEHYFGKQPSELTPREIAYLVCLIPSPVRYHESHEAGRVGPGMERLMDNLLVKLRSVDAIDDAALQAARAEVLQFRPEDSTQE